MNVPKFGFINLHASLLPKWRGAAPIQRAIMNLDSETGVSIMKIVEKLDAGPIYYQDNSINENINFLVLSKILSQIGAKSIIKVINKIESEEINLKEQNHKEATYAKKYQKRKHKLIGVKVRKKF